MHSAPANLLRANPFFANLAEASLTGLAAQAILRTIQAGSLLYLDGDPSAGFWLIERGLVKTYKLSPDGQEYILNFFRPGDALNFISAIDQGPNPASAMALTGVVAWVLSAATLKDLIERDADFRLVALTALTRQARNLIGQVEDLALRSVTSRLARFLLEKLPQAAQTQLPVVTRNQLASHLATTPESISRSLRTLETRGAIRFDRHRIHIHDLEILREAAQL